MTEIFEPVGEFDTRLVVGASGRLAELNAAGFLEAADVHVATRAAHLADEQDEDVVLAAALAVRAVRHGSVCADLAGIAQVAPELGWPETKTWMTKVAGSKLLDAGALQLDGGLVYLDRYHRLEGQVCADLLARSAQPPPAVDEAALEKAVARLRSTRFSDEQEHAARSAVRRWTTVLTGGPGTGKTTLVARLLALFADQAREGRRLSIALSAPTGKAASRLQDAVDEELAELAAEDRDRVGRLEAMTLHRLLGWRSDNQTRFRHDRANRLKYDVVVVDEASMVELTMMARLLEAVRPQARLVLVGDPRQLTSVGAGAVLSDLVAGYEGRADSPVVSLSENFRSTRDILAVADALREGDVELVLERLRTASDEVEFVETTDAPAVLRDDAMGTALAVRAAASVGDAATAVRALDGHRLLCAHREGPYGVRHWNTRVEQWLAEETGQPVHGPWYVGQPLLVTSNDYTLNVYNGETGAVIRTADGRLRAFISGAGGLRDIAPGRLDAVETMHAMTIHKAQGSQAERVTVLLPEEGSRLLTRELFYTAVTRAKQHVRVVGSEAAVRVAVATQAQRATGLQRRIAES